MTPFDQEMRIHSAEAACTHAWARTELQPWLHEQRSQAAQGQLRHIYNGTRLLRGGFSSSAHRDVDKCPAPLSIFRK